MRFNVRVLVWATFAYLYFFAGSLATDIPDDSFLYFAYGSNLYDKRLHVNNPTAKFYSAAILKDYRLDFNITVPLWHGAVATICNEPGDIVWGALWVMKQSDRKNLDRQEGVSKGWYYATNVTVNTINGNEMTALTYIQHNQPKKLPSWKVLPYERRPSFTYINVIMVGAAQVGIPLQYLKMLCSIPDNNKVADQTILKQLGSAYNICILDHSVNIDLNPFRDDILPW